MSRHAWLKCFIAARTRKDTIMPLYRPIRGVDGQAMYDIHVPKATTIIIGIRASNLNRSVWGEDVREWKPERWLKPLPEEVINAHIPGVYSNL